MIVRLHLIRLPVFLMALKWQNFSLGTYQPLNFRGVGFSAHRTTIHGCSSMFVQGFEEEEEEQLQPWLQAQTYFSNV